MPEDVSLVEFRGEPVYVPIFDQLDRLKVGGKVIVRDPAPHRKIRFSERLLRAMSRRDRDYKISVRTTRDGRLEVTKKSIEAA